MKTNYERVSDQELSYKEDKVKTFVYNLATPVYYIVNCIKPFQNLCMLIENQKFDRQLVQVAYLIFSKTKAFVYSLKREIRNLLLTKKCQLQDVYRKRTAFIASSRCFMYPYL